MKKKTLSIMLSIALGVSALMTGCGGSGTQTAERDGGDKASERKTEGAKDAAASGKEVVRVVVPGISEETTVDPISGIKKKGLGEFEAFLEEQIPDYDIDLVSGFIKWRLL